MDKYTILYEAVKNFLDAIEDNPDVLDYILEMMDTDELLSMQMAFSTVKEEQKPFFQLTMTSNVEYPAQCSASVDQNKFSKIGDYEMMVAIDIFKSAVLRFNFNKDNNEKL